MSQAWVQVTGLFLDFFGFALIAWEWLLAQRAERAQRAIEARHARDMEMSRMMQRHQQTTSPHAQGHMQRHHEVWDDMRTQQAQRAVEATRTSFATIRYGVIYAGLLLVFLGFTLQVLGTVPGCCGLIGIVPGSP